MFKISCRSVNILNNIRNSTSFYNNITSKFVSVHTKNSRFNNTLKLSLIGASVGVIAGTSYSLVKSKHYNPNDVQFNSITTLPVLEDVPDIKPSRKIQIPNDTTDLKITLYQYQTCPFCCKVRAFLDYYGISYNVIEVDPVLRQSIQWSEYKKVPILIIETADGYQQLNDSSMIISALASLLADRHKTVSEITKNYQILKYIGEDGKPKSEILNKYFLMLDHSEANNRKPEDIMNEQKWRKWTDEVLVHVLSPNVYRTREEALQAFNWFSDVGDWETNFPTWERFVIIYVGAFAMWLIGKRLKKRHSLKEDVRQSLYDECNKWTRAIHEKGTPFMGGTKPNLSDLAVYGILNSIEGCYAFQDLLQYSSISKWYNQMKQAVNNHQGLSSI